MITHLLNKPNSFIINTSGEKSWLQKNDKRECFALPSARSFAGKWATILIHDRNI